ncbi:MAG: CPBP family intramembrane glutamic endopeptidase [Terriglobales bacterium]
MMRKSWKEAGLGSLNLLAVIVVIVAAQPVLRKHLPHMVGGVLLALLVLATYVAASKWIERRTPSELNVRRLLPEVAAGFAVGLVLFACGMAILWAAGVYHPAGGGTANGLARGLVSALIAGVVEETLFRGLLLRLSSKILGTWGALLFTAALFGASHAFNRGATVGSSLAIAIEAGVLLGAAYAATQSLWVPIGLHIGWNFTEGSIFSLSVSGNSVSAGLIQGSLSGPQILTGGQFGPEASIVAVIVCLAAALYFIRRITTLHRAEPAAWSKTRQFAPVAPASLG